MRRPNFVVEPFDASIMFAGHFVDCLQDDRPNLGRFHLNNRALNAKTVRQTFYTCPCTTRRVYRSTASHLQFCSDDRNWGTRYHRTASSYPPLTNNFDRKANAQARLGCRGNSGMMPEGSVVIIASILDSISERV